MQRPPNVPAVRRQFPLSKSPASKTNNHALAAHDSVGSFWDMLGIRIIFTADFVLPRDSFSSVQRFQGIWLSRWAAVRDSCHPFLNSGFAARVCAG